MRTAINATWIVGHENGRHALIHDGTLVYEGNRMSLDIIFTNFKESINYLEDTSHFPSESMKCDIKNRRIFGLGG